MKVNLLKGSISYGIVTILTRIASIILIPIITKLLSLAEYGLYGIAILTITLVTLVVTLEVSQAVTYFFTDIKIKDRNVYPSTGMWFTILMYLIIVIIAFIFEPILSNLFKFNSNDSSIIFYSSLLLAGNGIFFFIQNLFRLEFKTKAYSFFTLGYVFFMAGGSICGILFFQKLAQNVILGQFIGIAIVDFLGIIVYWKLLILGFDFVKLRKMLKFSLPLVFSGVLLLGGQQLPRYILSVYGSLEDVGMFVLSYQIAGFAALSVLGVQTSITPAVLVNHEHKETKKKLGTLFENFVIVSLIFCAGLSVFSKEIVTVFSNVNYLNAAAFVPVLSFSIIFNSLYIFFQGKIIKGKSARQLLPSIGSFFVALITGFVLTKYDGIRGATLATLLSSIAFFTIWVRTSQKLYPIPVNWKKLAKYLCYTIATCCVGVFIFTEKLELHIILIKLILIMGLICLIGWQYVLMVRYKYLQKKYKTEK